jgi:hypothetical protein
MCNLDPSPHQLGRDKHFASLAYQRRIDGHTLKCSQIVALAISNS